MRDDRPHSFREVFHARGVIGNILCRNSRYVVRMFCRYARDNAKRLVGVWITSCFDVPAESIATVDQPRKVFYKVEVVVFVVSVVRKVSTMLQTSSCVMPISQKSKHNVGKFWSSIP